MKFKKLISFAGIAAAVAMMVSACSQKQSKQANSNKINIVTTTNVYADIAKNVVGKYGTVESLISKSSTDPHDFEPTTADAKKLANANIIVENGLGYDSWMNKLASSVSKKPVSVGEDLMGLKKGDNPHIWYNLSMPKKYVNYLVKRLSKIDKKHASYFKENGDKYLAKIDKLQKTAKSINGKDKKPVYVSEPVFDYALQEAGFKIGDKEFEEAVENGTDPAPKVINQMTNAINGKKIAFFVNNTQASSSTVNTFVKLAKKNKIPVMSIRETIPDNTTYLKWMQDNYAELAKIAKE